MNTTAGSTRADQANHSAEGDVVVPERASDPVMLRLAPGEEADLAVFVGGVASYCEQRLAIAGRSERVGAALRFTPAFGFVAAQDYVVRTRRGAEPHRLTPFRIPRVEAVAPAQVTAVYPSGQVLPENVLRFYVHFSVPMQPHLASDFISLRDETGQVDRGAFMTFKQELWNADRTRLTVLVDPGRIKRNVATRNALGPALRDGHRYALTVDEGWPTADGTSVLASFSKPFQVSGALRERPDPEAWTWRPPRPETREPLVVAFDRPFDRHLLDRAVHVVSSDGRLIVASAQPGRAETSLRFTPREPWPTDDVRIVVDEALEDVAGNSVDELLDRHVGPRPAHAVDLP